MKINQSRWLKITERTFYNKNVKKDLKVVFLSDLHLSKKVSFLTLNFIKEQLKKEKPNYVCFLGDLVDQPCYLNDEIISNWLFEFISEIAKMAKVMIVLGNHDLWGKNKQIVYNKKYWQKIQNINNVYLLNNEKYQDDEIFFMGYLQEFSYYEEMKKKPSFNYFYNFLKNESKFYKNLPKNKIKIGLFHSPEFYQDKRIIELLKNYDLLLAGHCHEGCLPFFLDNLSGNRGIIAPNSKLFPKLVRGLYKLSTNTKLVISGGITKIQEVAPKFFYIFNFFCYRHMDVLIFSNLKKEIEYEEKVKKIYQERG